MSNWIETEWFVIISLKIYRSDEYTKSQLHFYCINNELYKFKISDILRKNVSASKIDQTLNRNQTETEGLSRCNWTRAQNHLVCKRTLNHLAKWLSARFRTKWLRVRVQLQSLKLQISRLLRGRSSWTFRQLYSVDSLWNAYVTWEEHTVSETERLAIFLMELHVRIMITVNIDLQDY